MAESSAGDFTVGKIQKTRRQRVAKMYGQQKWNIIHMSSTAYEQDHSAAAPPSSVMNSRRFKSTMRPPPSGRTTASSACNRRAGKSLGQTWNVLNRGVNPPLKCLQPDQDSTWRAARRPCGEGCTTTAPLDFRCSCQASAKQFQQRAESPLLCNGRLGPFAVTILAISPPRRGTATQCAAVQSATPLYGEHA